MDLKIGFWVADQFEFSTRYFVPFLSNRIERLALVGRP
jgi:hypothetical protein